MKTYEKYLKEASKSDVQGLMNLIQGKKTRKKKLPTEAFMKRTLAPEVFKKLKKGVDYQ